jgi:hypothetical protein
VEHVAVVRRALIENNFARQSGFSTRLAVTTVNLERLAAHFEGVAIYLSVHKGRDSVQLVITEPGEKSALRSEIERRHAIPPALFQTGDAFINLARSARRELIILAPFIDNQGAEFLLSLFALCAEGVRRYLICRPLSEPHCGPAFHRRIEAFFRLKVSVYEYALPSSLTFPRKSGHRVMRLLPLPAVG